MTVVFCLEEPSAREMLKGFLPRLFPGMTDVTYVVFEGRQDLEKHLGRRLRGWRTPDTIFIVLCDQDAGDCTTLKRKLVRTCRAAGKPEALVRIACHELESWYFGDLTAVERGLRIPNLVRYGNKRRYRVPDTIRNPSNELEKITRNAYQKVSGSRAIGRYLSGDSNKSRSFRVFVEGMHMAVGRAAQF